MTKTSIQITAGTRDRLKARKRGGEDWEDLLEKMLAQYDPDAIEATALAAMDGTDRIEAQRRGDSPTEYIEAEYGLDASEFDSGEELHDAIIQGLNARRTE